MDIPLVDGCLEEFLRQRRRRRRDIVCPPRSSLGACVRARGEGRLERVRAPQRRCDVPSAVAAAAIAIQDGKKIRTDRGLEIELMS